MSYVVPPSFLFGLQLPLKGCNALGKSKRKSLLNLSQQHQLFIPSMLNDQVQFATVSAGWHPDGLALQFDISGKPEPPSGDSSEMRTSDAILLWLDTRPSGEVHRATEYCHHFAILPADAKNDDQPVVLSQPIAQQRATKIDFNAGQFEVQTTVSKSGYRCEVWIPRTQLYGYREVSEIGRIGFQCLIQDGHLGDQPFHLSGDFPTGYDPSTWITLELEQ